MDQRCPLCHEGILEEMIPLEGKGFIQCSEYPACRFTADSWDKVAETSARFHHPVMPGQ